jgi:hypothetical protein
MTQRRRLERANIALAATVAPPLAARLRPVCAIAAREGLAFIACGLRALLGEKDGWRAKFGHLGFVNMKLCHMPTARLVGLTAFVFSALYLLSDVIEAIQGGFSAGQLWLTLVAEAAIPVFVLGLYLVQRAQMGRLGRISAVAYAYSFVFFTATVVYALIEATSDYNTLSQDLRPWMTIHGAIMVLAGVGFGLAVIRAGVLPPWTGIALMAGVVLVAVSQNLPEGLQVLAAGVRDLGFAGMGAALLQTGAVSGRRTAAQST